MKLSKVEATVTVTGEAPLLDTRKVGTGAVVNRQEMDMIPSARDPWVVMQTVPGVQVDRMNVGGNQSGQQSIFMAKGAQTTQGSWNLDGVTVSDMASGASSPTYWDFDSFQELQAITGGSDPSIATAGVTLNMVTKRGTNDVHGSARVFDTDPKWQARPTITQEERAQSQAGAAGANFVGSQITGIQDYGLEVGGPILKDRMWLWGSYGRQQIDLLTVTGFPDKTTLEDLNGKLNFQVFSNNALTGFYLRGDKRKQGRSAATTRPPETTVDQSGPTALMKIEDNHVFSPSLVADVFYSYMDEGFKLVAEGADRNGPTVQTADGVYHNTFNNSVFGRPQHQLLGSASYFFNTGSLGHEIKVGGSYRDVEIRSNASWFGGGLIGFAANSPGDCTVGGVAHRLRRDHAALVQPHGLELLQRLRQRHDHRGPPDGVARPALRQPEGPRRDGDDAGERSLSDDPAGGEAPQRDGVHWKDISPRFGATYALGEARKTLARLSYARYANQLGSYPNSSLSAIPGVAYAYYPWDDNGNGRLEPGEINTSGAPIRTVNFNPANPTSPSPSTTSTRT